MTKREPVNEVIEEFLKKLNAEPPTISAVLSDLRKLADEKKLADTLAVSTALRQPTKGSNEAA